MLKEGYDDYKRFKRDKENNESKYKIVHKSGYMIETKCSELKVGDVVEVCSN